MKHVALSWDSHFWDLTSDQTWSAESFTLPGSEHLNSNHMKRIWKKGQEKVMKHPSKRSRRGYEKTHKNVPRIPRDKLWESTNIFFGHFLTASFARWCPAVSLQLQFSRVRYLPWLPSFTHTAVPTTVCYHHLYFSIFVALFHHIILMMEYL